MQAIENDGTRRMPEPFDLKKMKETLDDPKVKEVRVFKPKKGEKIKIEGVLYKITTVRPNGKMTLRPITKRGSP